MDPSSGMRPKMGMGPTGPSVSWDTPTHPLDRWISGVNPNKTYFVQGTAEERKAAQKLADEHETRLARERSFNVHMGGSDAAQQAPVLPKDYLHWMDRSKGLMGPEFARSFMERTGKQPTQQDFQQAGLQFFQKPEDYLKQDDITRILETYPALKSQVPAEVLARML